MSKRSVALLVGAVAVAWWAGRWVADVKVPTPPAPAPAKRVTTKHPPPAFPVPKMEPVERERSEESPNALLETVLSGDLKPLTLQQLEGYLSRHHRDAESLLTASRLTQDLSLAREAAQRFPADPRAHLELAVRSEDPAEKQRAVADLARTDPDNALGPYLAADAAFAAGDSETAVRSLMDAVQRTTLTDYHGGSVESAEEAYLAAGLPATEARAAAVFGSSTGEGVPFRELGDEMSALLDSYAGAGDAASAQAVAGWGADLGQRIQQSMAHSVAEERTGTAVESRFLKAMDPAAVLDDSGLTAGQRLDQLTERNAFIKSLMRGADPSDPSLSPEIRSQYLDIAKAQGEVAAMKWLQTKATRPAP